jgi:hypothetical protein
MSSQNNNNLYASKESRLDTIMGNNPWWDMLQKAQVEYGTTEGAKEDFQFWLVDNYGVKILYDYDGILPTYEVVDEQKHTVFFLKFS